MSETPSPKRTKAHKSVLRRATLPMAIVALAAGLAFPNAAMAQISQTAASDFCAERPASFALANNIRVEPAAGPISFSKASAILGGGHEQVGANALLPSFQRINSARRNKPKDSHFIRLYPQQRRFCRAGHAGNRRPQ